jgi:hypothetical protein
MTTIQIKINEITTETISVILLGNVRYLKTFISSLTLFQFYRSAQDVFERFRRSKENKRKFTSFCVYGMRNFPGHFSK